MPVAYMPSIWGILIVDILRVCGLIFIAITFLQSGTDKLLDYKGNREYFTAHFKNSPLAKQAAMLLPVITLLELASGLLALAGIVFIFLGQPQTGALATVLALFTLLCLFFGQRMAKAYAEAAGIVPYIIMVTLVLIAFNI